jgi:oxygen-independent coproporphyrinogen-3 oxidase
MPGPDGGVTADGVANGARARLRQAIADAELPSYVYSYPSKRAYRPVEPSRTVAEAWSDAPSPLNLYVHIPFCRYRCAFCTLFLTTSHTADGVEGYLDSLVRQIAMYGALLGDREVTSIYIGGGTPTLLTPRQIERLFAALNAWFPRRQAGAECGVEGSPDTMTPETVACLARVGVNRMSVGLQTLDALELRRVGRPYTLETVRRVVEAIRATGFENVNYDLIYGLEGQVRATWLRSLHGAIDFAPQTLTLYPVVFRPLTAIERRRERDGARFLGDADKYALYDESVDILAEHGYRQDSFVRFTTLSRDGYQQEAADFSGVPLLGLGAGARSYAAATHYGTDFAVGRKSTNAIIAGFIAHDHRPDEALTLGFVLSEEEQKRRFCILTLSLGRLDPAAYERRFPGSSLAEFAGELDALEAEGCVESAAGGLRSLTRRGFKYSNVIATLFRSDSVAELERTYVAV